MIEINKVLNSILDEFEELPNELVQGLTNDSSKVKKGFIFFAFKGNNYDGNDFIEHAFKNGACLVITDNENIEIQKNVIKVQDVRTAAGIACSNFYNFPQSKVRLIGITGTNGKTSTSTILKSILDLENEKTLQVGTSGIKPSLEINTGLTTPDIFDLYEILNCAVNHGFKNVILEVSSHALSQRRIENIFFDITAFTNLTLDHLDYHRTMEEYFNEKLKLFDLNKENGSSVVLIDNEYGKRVSKLNSHAKRISLVTKDSDYFCTTYVINDLGISGTLAWDSKTLNFESKLIGKFNLENLIVAAAIAVELNISRKSISEGIKNCTNIVGRLHLVKNKRDQMIFLDYGHTPDAYLKVLKTLKDNFGRPIKVLFGAGGGRDKSKRPKMAEVVEKFSVESYLAPDNPRFEDIKSINDDVINGFSNENHHSFDDRKEALEFALKNLQLDEILIIFGKGIEEYQEINGTKHFYSDSDIIKEFYEN